MIPTIKKRLSAYEKPKKKAFSLKYPWSLKFVIFIKRLLTSARNLLTLGFRLKREAYLPCILARHSSLLYRKLGDTDQGLQINKVKNLQIAIGLIDGLVIPPHKTFSLWHHLGATTKARGYVDGLVLSEGNPAQAIGGGLCQLANFLFWIFLHTDVKVVERHYHSVDAFPDSGRTIPFGSGATIYYNYLDLKIKNISDQSLQIKLWLTDSQLKGQIRSDKPALKKFHLKEANHYFVKHKHRYFRYNEIHRETFIKGKKVKDEEIIKNFAPVKYAVNKDYLKANEFKILEF